MLNRTMRCRLLAITISHYIIVDRGRCELVLIVIEQILLMLVCLNTSILHLGHEVDSCAPACCLQWKNLLLIFQGLWMNVMHAAFREISRRSQVTYPYVRCCVMFSQRPSSFIVSSKRLVCCRSTLTIVFLLGTWIIRSSISPLLLWWNVFLRTCRCIQSLITRCSLTTRFNISISRGLLALRSRSRNRISWWMRRMIYPLAQNRHILPSRFLDDLWVIDIVMDTGGCIIIIPPCVLLGCLD